MNRTETKRGQQNLCGRRETRAHGMGRTRFEFGNGRTTKKPVSGEEKGT